MPVPVWSSLVYDIRLSPERSRVQIPSSEYYRRSSVGRA